MKTEVICTYMDYTTSTFYTIQKETPDIWMDHRYNLLIGSIEGSKLTEIGMYYYSLNEAKQTLIGLICTD